MEDDPARRRAEACRLHQNGDIASAVVAYQDYLREQPGDHAIWCNLGVGLRVLGEREASAVCYRRALKLEENDASYWGNLGNVLNDLDEVDEAVSAHRRALGLDPGNLLLQHNLALALANACRFQEALEVLDRCLEIEPEHPAVNWDRASVLLHLERYPEGWAAYEWRWRAGQVAPSPYDLPTWQGEPISGQTLLVYADQGFGDTLWASRFIPVVAARGVTVVLACHRRLHRLLRGLEGLCGLAVPGETVPSADYHCALMSLPGLVGAGPESLPRPRALSVPTDCRTRAEARLTSAGERLKVGIVWSGNAGYAYDRQRSVPLSRFLPLARLSGVQLYSLHKAGPDEDSVAAQISAIDAEGLVIDLCSEDKDFADAAGAVQALDLVVSTDTAVAHLAGTLSQPVWCLLSHSPLWIHGYHGEASPWYPLMKLYRQPRPGDWDAVFAAVDRDLRRLASSRAEC